MPALTIETLEESEKKPNVRRRRRIFNMVACQKLMTQCHFAVVVVHRSERASVPFLQLYTAGSWTTELCMHTWTCRSASLSVCPFIFDDCLPASRVKTFKSSRKKKKKRGENCPGQLGQFDHVFAACSDWLTDWLLDFLISSWLELTSRAPGCLSQQQQQQHSLGRSQETV